MRAYDLMRAVDVTGVSGVGRVAEVVEFDNGKVAVAWCAPGRPASVAIYDSLADAELVHMHANASQMIEQPLAPDPHMALGKRLQLWRAKYGFSQEYAAGVLRMSRTYLSLIERGLANNVSHKIAEAIRGLR